MARDLSDSALVIGSINQKLRTKGHNGKMRAWWCCGGAGAKRQNLRGSYLEK
jgi:hypothetical protein